MKTLLQTAYGEPGKVLELQEVADQIPEAGEVVIGMEAAVVHVADLHTVAGLEGFRKPLPRTPGYEGIGRVLAVGPAVRNVAIGERVLSPIGSGTHREQVKVAADQLVHAPEGDAEQLALLSVNPASAFILLRDFVQLAEGDWIIQNAANSSIGRALLQLAGELKLRVVNVVKSPEVAAELANEGATSVLLDDEHLAHRVSSTTNEAPIRVAFDALGGSATARLIACLDHGGTIVLHGAISGSLSEIPFHIMAARDIRLAVANPARRLAAYSVEDRKALYDQVGEWVARGRVKSRVAAVYPLEQAIEAYEHARRLGDKRFGKVVLRFRELPSPVGPKPDGGSAVGEPGGDSASPDASVT